MEIQAPEPDPARAPNSFSTGDGRVGRPGNLTDELKARGLKFGARPHAPLPEVHVWRRQDDRRRQPRLVAADIQARRASV